ncbi:MAG: type II CAAX endopeptidase family protein [Pseudomonadota bacterium]
MRTAPSQAGAMWLLARLRLRRLVNMTFSFRRRQGVHDKSRAASASKRRGRWLLGVAMALAMTFAFISLAEQSILNLHCKLDGPAACGALAAGSPDAVETAARELQAAPFSVVLSAALSWQLTLLWLVSFLLPLGSRELAQADWDLEWLVTLPVRRGTLLWGRLVERSIANPGGVLALWPTCMMLAWYAGHRWSAPLLAVPAALTLLMLAALVRTLVDTGLRLALPPSQLRNLQAMASVACLPVMYLAMSYSTWSSASFALEWARAIPSWMLWTPPGLAVQALNARSATQALGPALLLALQTGVLLYGGVALLRHQLRGGVVAAGARETARGPVSPPRPGRWRIGSPLQRRELLLLSRDRNFLVQSLLIPLIIVGSQLVFNGQLQNIALIGQNQHTMAAMAFGIGSYVLVLSAFQTLNTEGGALWMLYTFPQSVARTLKEKAQLWGVLALLYPSLVFGAGLYFSPVYDWRLLALTVTVLAGIPIYALIAVALGVFASDPLAQEAQARVRPAYVYLYMLLSSLYMYGLYGDDWMQTLAIVVLTASLALALWQKACDELPYLLDPASLPPARVSIADGLIAAMLFFVLQRLVATLLAGAAPGSASTPLYAFAAAGSIVYGVMRLVYWRAGTEGVPVIRPSLPGRAALTGVGAGVLAALACAGYMVLLRHTPWWPRQAPGQDGQLYWLLLLSVVAAPLCEEFIFRGLIFGGLRRLTGALPAALGSAALFSIVHPAPSMLPVFVLGLCTAWSYERSKSLLAPMLAHAVYNGAVIALQTMA